MSSSAKGDRQVTFGEGNNVVHIGIKGLVLGSVKAGNREPLLETSVLQEALQDQRRRLSVHYQAEANRRLEEQRRSLTEEHRLVIAKLQGEYSAALRTQQAELENLVSRLEESKCMNMTLECEIKDSKDYIRDFQARYEHDVPNLKFELTSLREQLTKQQFVNDKLTTHIEDLCGLLDQLKDGPVTP